MKKAGKPCWEEAVDGSVLAAQLLARAFLRIVLQKSQVMCLVAGERDHANRSV